MSIQLNKEEEDPIEDFLSSLGEGNVSTDIKLPKGELDFDFDFEDEENTKPSVSVAETAEANDTPDSSLDGSGGKKDRSSDIKGDKKSEEESSSPHTEAEEDYTGVSSDPFISVLASELGEEPDAELVQRLREEDPDEVKVLAGYMREVIKRKSVPQYASDEVAAFDKAVREGVDPYDYLQLSYSEPEYKDLDMTDADTRHIIIENYLKATTRLSDAKIQREIERMESILADAEDLTEDSEALAEIREYAEYLQEQKDAKKAAEIEAAKRERLEKEERAKSIQEDFKKQVMAADTLGGFHLTEKDKQGMIDYGLLVGKDGKTGYQRRISEDPKHVLELMYFSYKGIGKEKMMTNIRSEASKSILNKLRNYKDTVSSVSSGHAADTPKPIQPVTQSDDWEL